VGFYPYDHIEIPRRASCRPGVPLAGNDHPLAVLHPRWDGDHDLLSFLLDSGSAAFLTGLLDDITFPAAGMAGAGYGEKPLAVPDLARTLAGRAYFFPRAVSRPGPLTDRAAFIPGIGNFNLGPKDRVLKRYLNIVTEIGALTDPAVAATAGGAASAAEEAVENAAESPEVPENILEPPEGLGEILGIAGAHTFDTGKSELIIGGFFLIIREYLVRFGSLFKLLLSFLITRIFIRMILNSELSVSLFYIILGDVLLYTENFVIIPFSQAFTL
jgi:hypothetical protein